MTRDHCDRLWSGHTCVRPVILLSSWAQLLWGYFDTRENRIGSKQRVEGLIESQSHVQNFHEDNFEGQCVTGTDRRLDSAEAVVTQGCTFSLFVWPQWPRLSVLCLSRSWSLVCCQMLLARRGLYWCWLRLRLTRSVHYTPCTVYTCTVHCTGLHIWKYALSRLRLEIRVFTRTPEGLDIILLIHLYCMICILNNAYDRFNF